VPSDTEAAAISQFVLQIQSSLGRLVRERPDRAYPPLARDQGWEGISQVRVEFVSGGKVKSIEVVISSGYAALDQRAREMVKEVMPKVPDELRDREFSVRFPIVFKRFNR
jgi:TonB family protein